MGPALAAAAASIERQQRLPEPVQEQLHRSRLLRMLLPRSVGGDQIEPVAYCRAVAEIARHDASVAWIVFVANSAALIAAFLDEEVARTIFADPRTLVAWGPPNATRALAVDGGYRLSGTWDFASGCRHANWMGAHCHVSEADGSLRLNRHGRPTIRTLLFPAEQATLIDTWNVIGLRGTGSDSYRVEDLFVPEAFTTTREDPTLRRERGPLYAFTMQGLYAVGVAASRSASRGRCSTRSSSLACSKIPARRWQRLADSAVVQGGCGAAEAKLGAARAYLLETLSSIYCRRPTIRTDRRCPTVHGFGSPAPTPFTPPSRSPTSPTRPPASMRFSGQPLRAPLPRHPHPVTADPIARRAFRGRWPNPARQPPEVFF